MKQKLVKCAAALLFAFGLCGMFGGVGLLDNDGAMKDVLPICCGGALMFCAGAAMIHYIYGEDEGR